MFEHAFSLLLPGYIKKLLSIIAVDSSAGGTRGCCGHGDRHLLQSLVQLFGKDICQHFLWTSLASPKFTFSSLKKRYDVTAHLLKLVDLSDEKVSVSTSHFRVCDVNHVLWWFTIMKRFQTLCVTGYRQ